MRKLMAWSLIACLLLVLMGCGTAQEEEPRQPTEAQEEADDADDPDEEEGDEPHEEQAAEPEALASFHQIEKMRDIIKAFSLLEFAFSDDETEVTITYERVGAEVVGDKTADHVTVTIAEADDGSQLDVWMDEDGNTLRLVVDGEDAGPMGPMMADMLLMIVVFPFAMYASEWEDAFVESDGFHRYGWTSVSHERTSRDLGAGEMAIHQYRFQHTYQNQQLDYRFEVAEVSGWSMFVGWEVELAQEEKTTFRVKRMVPR